MVSITGQLAEFAVNLKAADIPTTVRARAKDLLLDTVGIAIRARHDTASTHAMLAALERMEMTHGATHVIGDDKTYPAAIAALINGACAHSLDFDDTHAAGSLHSSAPIVPAALAAAEMTGADGAATLAAIIAGYEVQIRLSLALVPSEHYSRGYHPTATCGAFGAAVAAGCLLGLDVAQMRSAFGIALSQSSGSMKFLQEGAWTKRSQVGHAAYNGLMAATLAAEDYQGPAEAFDGQWSFLAAYAPNPDANLAIAGLGTVWQTMGLAVKPYPSCRYSHAAMDALQQLKAKHELSEGDIQHVEIGLPQTGLNIIGHPIAQKHAPVTIVDGQFSMPFLAAVILRTGNLGWDDYDSQLADPVTLALTAKVNCIQDPKAEAEYPANMAGIARVTTSSGVHEAMVVIPKGEPDNFLSQDELTAKFDGLTAPYLSKARRDALVDALVNIDQRSSISEVLRLTRPDVAALKMAGED